MTRVCSDPRAWVGIDVAKATLDVVLRLPQQSVYHIFANTSEGHLALDGWLQLSTGGAVPSEIKIVLEATGSYSDAVSQALFTAGYHLCVLNPAVLVDYRRSHNTRSKTDKLDAHMLARYAQDQQQHPHPWTPLPEPIHSLRQLLHHRDDIQHLLRQERNRLEAGRMDDWISQHVHSHVAELRSRLKACEKRIKEQVKAHAVLLHLSTRLRTIPGIGWLTAARLLAHIGDLARFEKVGSLVSLAGLAISEHSSGSSVHGHPHIDRHGRPDLRQTLYMSALVALRVSPAFQAWGRRLQEAGKPKKVVLVAIMRKLLHIVYGVWKTDRDFDASVAFPQAA